jgi:hypothetical protein
MKIKNKVIGTILGVIASSVLFISVSESANAGECSASDPCQTWAMLDENNVVINIIVCQPSVCGSGIWNDRKVVLQVSADPVTNTSRPGHYNREPEKQVTYNEQQKTFSQEGVTWAAPQVNVEVVETITATGAVETTTLTAAINLEGLKTNPATISATQGELSESKTFNEPKTSAEFENSIQDSTIIKKHLNKFLQLLRGWIIA